MEFVSLKPKTFVGDLNCALIHVLLTVYNGCYLSSIVIMRTLVNYIYKVSASAQVIYLSTEYARQSTEGYPTMVDLSVGMRVIRNQMVTQSAETTI